MTRLGEAGFLQGVDRDGKKWSVLAGSVVLTKRLIEGLVEEWDDDRGAFVVVKTEGRVQPGEVVSIKYIGDREGTKYDYPDFRVSRKPAAAGLRPGRAPLRDAIAAHLALLDDDVGRLDEILAPYYLDREARELVVAALYLARTERDVDELREELERLARGGAGRAESA